jgi:cyclophilin family peptidyl-prolyl cis-trans isomerase
MKSQPRMQCHQRCIQFRKLVVTLQQSFVVFSLTSRFHSTFPVVTHRVYLAIEMDDKSIGAIVLGLFGDIAPKAVQNFVALCNCDRGKGKFTGKDLCYKGSKIHRVITNFMIQGGDFSHGNGTGGESVFGGYFEDESFDVKHSNRRYMLSMANSGKKNTNLSQWYIDTVKTQWLDGKDVVFGMVLEGKQVIYDNCRLWKPSYATGRRNTSSC